MRRTWPAHGAAAVAFAFALVSLYWAAGGMVATVALLYLGVFEDSQDRTESALLWRMFLWEPWFLVWGVLLGLAAWRFTRRRPPP